MSATGSARVASWLAARIGRSCLRLVVVLLAAVAGAGCNALEVYLGALPDGPRSDLAVDLTVPEGMCERPTFDLGPSCNQGGTLTAIAFHDERAVSVGGAALAAAVADLDGDGRSEVVVVLAAGYVILRNPGDGTLRPGAIQPLPIAATLVAIGDYDGDGALDLAFGGGSRISIERNQGTCGFVHAITVDAQMVLGDLRSGFINIDRLADLAFTSVVPNARGATEGIAYGAAGLRIEPVLTYGVNGRRSGLALADLDSDGADDLVIAEAGSLSVGPRDAAVAQDSLLAIFYADRAGGLRRDSELVSVHNRVLGVGAADLDLDGALDLVVRYSDPLAMGRLPAGVATFHNNRIIGAPVALRGDFPTDGDPSAVAVADFDHDGRLDVIIATGGAAPQLIPVRNAGAVSGSSVAAPRAVAVGVTDLLTVDLDCDPYPDLLLVHGGSSLGVMVDASSN